MIPALLVMVVTSTSPTTLERCKQDLVWTVETYEAVLDAAVEDQKHQTTLCQIRVTELQEILAARTTTTAAGLIPPPEPAPVVVDGGTDWGLVLGVGAAGLAVGALATVISMAAGGAFK